MWWFFAGLVLVGADFAVVGDWGRAGTGEQMAMANTLNSLELDFVVSTGDNFYPTGLTSVTDPQAHDWVRVYDASVPWYVCLGNHDYYGNVQAQIDMTNVYSKWHMLARYYDVVVGDIHIWFLDTTPLLEDNPVHPEKRSEWSELEQQRDNAWNQYKWLEAGLQNSTAMRKLIIGHHPLWTFGEHKFMANDELRVRVSEWMMLYDVEAYICGHDHSLQHVSSFGLQEFVSGSGAWSYEWDWSTDRNYRDSVDLHFGSSKHGFMLVSGKTYAFYSASGILMYTVDI